MSTILQEIDVVVLDPEPVDLVEVLVDVLAAPCSGHAGMVFERRELVRAISRERPAGGRFTSNATTSGPAYMACSESKP